MRGVGNENLKQLCETKNRFKSCDGHGGPFSYLIFSCWGLFGTCFVLSDKLSEMECPREEQCKGGKTVSSALKSLIKMKHPYSTFKSKKNHAKF